MYVALPLYHTTGLCVGWAGAFGVGAATAIRRKFSVTHFWDDIRKFNATAFTYVGELCRYLINQPPSPNDSNNPVRTIVGNGLRPDIWLDFKKRFGITKVGELYGAAETTAPELQLSTANHPACATLQFRHGIGQSKGRGGAVGAVTNPAIFTVAGSAVFKGCNGRIENC